MRETLLSMMGHGLGVTDDAHGVTLHFSLVQRLTESGTTPTQGLFSDSLKLEINRKLVAWHMIDPWCTQ